MFFGGGKIEENLEKETPEEEINPAQEEAVVENNSDHIQQNETSEEEQE